MKKYLLIIVALIAGLLSLTACTAEAALTVNEQTDIAEFVGFSGKIVEVNPFYETSTTGEIAAEDKFFILVEAEANADGYSSRINFFIDQNTVLVAGIDFELGMEVIGFYETGLPVPMIYPAQHHARVLMPVAEGESIHVGRFDQNWRGFNTPLQLKLEQAEIFFEDGLPFTGATEDLIERALVVVYSQEADSQMVASKVIILFERAVAPIHYLTEEELVMLEDIEGSIEPDTSWQGGLQLTQEEINLFWDNMFDPATVQIIVNGEAIAAPTPLINREVGFVLLPVVYIAEALGYQVNILSDTELMIGHSMLTIGLDSYHYNRMAAVELGLAPEVHNGVVFVPLPFFGNVFPDSAYIMDGDILIESPEFWADSEDQLLIR